AARASSTAWFQRVCFHVGKCLASHSRRARSQPMSLPAFSLSIHLYLRISSCCDPSISARGSLFLYLCVITLPPSFGVDLAVTIAHFPPIAMESALQPRNNLNTLL